MACQSLRELRRSTFARIDRPRASVDILRLLVTLARCRWLAVRSSLTIHASEGWYRYGESNPGSMVENHVSWLLDDTGARRRETSILSNFV